jgi:hypothetical protein
MALQNLDEDASVLDRKSPSKVRRSTALAGIVSGDMTMQGVKGLIVLSAVVAAVALGACRREVAHEPMKLGADLPVAEQVAR